MGNLRNLLLDEFKLIVKDHNFNNVMGLLKNGNYILEVNIIESYWKDHDSDSFDTEYPLLYIYDNVIYEYREQLYKFISTNKSIHKRDSLKKDFKQISRALETCGVKGIFDNIINILDEGDRDNFNDEEGGVWGITFVIDSFLILKINYCSGESFIEMDRGGWIELFDPKDYPDIDLIQEDAANIRKITNEIWFGDLEINSQNLINAGTNMLNLVFLPSKDKIFLDYSALLLPFVKAAECEISILLKQNKKRIVEIAKTIYDYLNKLFQSKEKKNINSDLLRLKEFSKQVIDGDRLNSISFLYCLIDFYEIGADLTLLHDKLGFLTKDKHDYLIKEPKFIKSLKLLGAERNDLIHARLIQSKNEFEVNYIYLCSALEVMSKIKNKENVN